MECGLGCQCATSVMFSPQAKGNDARADVPRGKEDESSASGVATDSIHNLDTALSMTRPRGCECHQGRRSECGEVEVRVC